MNKDSDNWIIVSAALAIVAGAAMIFYSYRKNLAPAIAKVTASLPASLLAQVGTTQSNATTTATTPAQPVYIDLSTVLPNASSLQGLINGLTPVKKSDQSANVAKYEYVYNGYRLVVYARFANPDGTLNTLLTADVYPKAPATLGYEINYGSVTQKYSSFTVKNNAPNLKSFKGVNGLPALK